MVGLAGVTAIESRPVRAPVPDKLTVCGLVLALSVTVKVPVRVPGAVGVNATEIEQEAAAPNVPGDNGQVEVCAKSPEVEIPEMVSGSGWLFLSVTVFLALLVPIPWLAKARLAGDKVAGVVPVPLKVAVWGEFEALSLTVSVPVRPPRALGVNVTEIVQRSFAANVFGDSGQVEVEAKSPAVEIPAILKGAV
jgi:hypothetical protein